MNMIRVTLRATLIAGALLGGSLLTAEHVWAGRVSNPNGMVFRALGIFQGEVEEGRCKVPSAISLISDSSRSICRDATEIASTDGSQTLVYPTRMFPELGNPFGNFCGGFIGMQSNLLYQAINVYKVRVRYKVAGRGFPILCRNQRKFNVFVGARVDPSNSLNPAPFGAVNQAYVQLLPIFSPQLLNCIRDPSLEPLAGPVTLIAKIRAFGILDDGRKIKSNKVSYSLTLLPRGSSGAGSQGIPPLGFVTRCAAEVQ